MARVTSNNAVRKPPISDLLPDLAPGRKERHGTCFRCGGKDRFVAFLNTGRGWCRQCGWKGDAVQLLIDRDGLSFVDAQRALRLDPDPSPGVRRKARMHSLALAAATRAYDEWQRETFRELADRYQELSLDCRIAEVKYCQIHLSPDLYSDEECSFWTHKLADLYDTRAALEDLLDVLTYRSTEAERFALWRRESEAARV